MRLLLQHQRPHLPRVGPTEDWEGGLPRHRGEDVSEPELGSQDDVGGGSRNGLWGEGLGTWHYRGGVNGGRLWYRDPLVLKGASQSYIWTVRLISYIKPLASRYYTWRRYVHVRVNRDVFQTGILFLSISKPNTVSMEIFAVFAKVFRFLPNIHICQTQF